MKTLEFFYQTTEIHFLLNPNDKHVMVNATEMAKLFGKRTDHYLSNDTTKAFISALERTQKSEYSENKVPDMSGTLSPKILENRGRNGVYFCELLAIDFATWLDVDFKVWVYSQIQDIIFGNYKKHWEAHAMQEQAKLDMEQLKNQLLQQPTTEHAQAYFEAQDRLKLSKSIKISAIKNQYKLFANS